MVLDINPRRRGNITGVISKVGSIGESARIECIFIKQLGTRAIGKCSEQ